ncbi:MAG: hypothetical protein ACRDM2_03190 [Gaiellaceae bacterium]
MRTARRIVLIVACLLAVAAPAATSGQGGAQAGGTRVSVDGSTVTITVTIDMMYGGFGTEEVPDGAQQAADALATDIESYWNQGFERYGSECLELRMDVVMTVLANTIPPLRLVDLGEDRELAFATEPGHHVVFYAEGDSYGNMPPPETYDPYDDDGVAPPGEDYASPFDHDLYAIWSPHLEDVRDFAHEFGHLLGLGDDYDANGALSGRDGTLMADGDLIDESLVSRLTDLARGANDDVPACETWEVTGDLQADQTLPSGDTCGQTGKAQGTIIVAAGGEVSGTLDVTEHEQCTFGFDRTRDGLALGLEGTASSSALTVRHTSGTTAGYFPIAFLTPAGAFDPIVLSITAPGVAKGSVTRDLPNDYTITVTLEARCVTCGAETE